MPTVHRTGNLRFVVFLDDHGPGERDDRPSLVWARGMARAVLRQAMVETLAHRGKLLLAWRRVHGSSGEERDER